MEKTDGEMSGCSRRLGSSDRRAGDGDTHVNYKIDIAKYIIYLLIKKLKGTIGNS